MVSSTPHGSLTPQSTLSCLDDANTKIRGGECLSTLSNDHIPAGSLSTFNEAIADPTAATTGENANDSGSFGGGEASLAPGLGMNYEDFTLFPENVFEIPVSVSKYTSFADIDAHSDNRDTHPSVCAQYEDTPFCDVLDGSITEPANQAFLDVLEKDYDRLLSSGYIPRTPSPSQPEPDFDRPVPFLDWLGTYHRHEDIAYLHEQPAGK
ncbi:hypothetical protein PZA11_007694 [Diplocarpon coronariae]|nr:hypothetical protein JHW43_007352 [Diplocarpon mali]